MILRAREIEGQIVEWRREFHTHPELGFEETRTAGRVKEEMESLGYHVRTGVGRTGVVAEMGEGHPVIGIRADMDALPIQEANDVPYTSKNPGVMHACGHDAHTAMALGVGVLLARESFPGTVRFLFQPAEELEDEQGRSGAARMLEDGALEGVDRTIALHVDSSIPVGDIAVEAGPVSAGVDTLYGAIIGKGGHGALPHKSIDPIYLSAHVILALHGIVSRRLRPLEPAVLSIGSIHGGTVDNVIPERVNITGTIRYLEPKVQEQIHAEVKRALEVARSLGGDYEFRIQRGYPPMHNDPAVVSVVEQVVSDLLGSEHLAAHKPEMGAEDFSFFTAQAPGAMFELGCLIEGDERVHHNPRFDLDERCLPIGAAILAETALRLLRGAASQPPTATA